MSEINRRNFSKGTAWSVPVVVAAVTAPQASASGTACPLMDDPSSWVISSPASGSIRQSPQDGFYTMANGSGLAYYVISDNSSNSAPATVRLTTTFSAVAGTSYSFTFAVTANGGGGSQQQAGESFADVIVDGQTLWTDRTYGTIPTYTNGLAPAQTNPAKNVTVSYTATTTGPVEYVIQWRLSSLNQFSNVNDDIAVTLPTVNCVAR